MDLFIFIFYQIQPSAAYTFWGWKDDSERLLLLSHPSTLIYFWYSAQRTKNFKRSTPRLININQWYNSFRRYQLVHKHSFSIQHITHSPIGDTTAMTHSVSPTLHPLVYCTKRSSIDDYNDSYWLTPHSPLLFSNYNIFRRRNIANKVEVSYEMILAFSDYWDSYIWRSRTLYYQYLTDIELNWSTNCF